MQEFVLHHLPGVTLTLHVLIVVGLALRVIMCRLPTGVALAWLLLVTAAPFAGAVIYLLFGERRIGRERARGIERLRVSNRRVFAAAIREGLTDVDWSRHPPEVKAMDRLGLALVGSRTVRGSSLELYGDAQQILSRLARDIDSAQRSLLIESYIWHAGGLADEVLAAVMRAAQRGVACCVLIDAVGARPWWRTSQPSQLRRAGVEVRPALPVGLFHTLFGRTDLRLHRKIIVIDGAAAWTGSMNLLDPRYFKQELGVGEWVDAMVRVEGAAVAPLAATMVGDWVLESGQTPEELVERHGLRLVDPQGQADVQVVPSGPRQTGDGLLQMILALVNSAHQQLVLTTPYLVPDESLLRALRGAAGRGVKVRVIVPQRVDSVLTRYASRSYHEDLLDVGAEIYLYRGGLLHTKSIVVDGVTSMFGTVNLDMRSFWLNYEVSLFVYDRQFAGQLAELQQSYIEDSIRVDPAEWAERPFVQRLTENTIRLVGPLL